MTDKQPKDPHSAAMLVFGLKLIGSVILICGVVGYVVYRIVK